MGRRWCEHMLCNSQHTTHKLPAFTVKCILVLSRYLFLLSHVCVWKPKADIEMSLASTASLSQYFLRPGLSLILQLTVNGQNSWAGTGMELSVPRGTVAAGALPRSASTWALRSSGLRSEHVTHSEPSLPHCSFLSYFFLFTLAILR